MNRREFIRAALLACGGAVVGVRGAPPALEELTLEAIPLDPRQLEFQGLRHLAQKQMAEATGLARVYGPPVVAGQTDWNVWTAEVQRRMADAIDELAIGGGIDVDDQN